MTGMLLTKEISFHPNPLVDRAVKLVLPFGLVTALLVSLYLTTPHEDYLTLAGLLAAYIVPPAGKESVIPIGIGLGEPWWLLAMIIVVIDLSTSLFVALNLDLTLKIPFIGPWIGRVMEGGQSYIRSHPWIGRLSTIGLTIFVIVPFQGSGGMNATILGRIMGLAPMVVVGCVLAGSIISSFGIALGTTAVLSLFRESVYLGCGALIAVAALITGIVLLWKRYAPAA
ncbi:MAG: small multi-drug export protein [Methanofollis sp.]|nr:small multi-drug export protein [Methanofollis sp.]